MDLPEIKAYYANMESYKLAAIAKTQISNLPPDVQSMVKEEVSKRGLGEGLLSAIAIQQVTVTPEWIAETKQAIRALPCPDCGQRGRSLVGVHIRKVRGLIFLTDYVRGAVIACPECAKDLRRKELFKNAMLGWWGFPWGLVRTPQAIIGHYTDQNRLGEISEAILTDFETQNSGELHTRRGDEGRLLDFIRHTNRLYR